MTVLRRSGTGLTALAFVVAASALASGQAKPRPDDTLGTLGAGIPMPQKWTPPTGPAPRLPNGKPDYSCEENNRSLWEGRIKLWVPPDSEPLRNPTLGAK
jgi:hypothetical protein